MAGGSTTPEKPITPQSAEQGGIRGFLNRFKREAKPALPQQPKDVSQDINKVRAELDSAANQVQANVQEAHPVTQPKPEREEPPTVPDIKNDYGTESPYQVTLNGKTDGKWQYAIRLPGNSDASYPKGHLLRVPGTATEGSYGDVVSFGSLDEALDFAMAKNREDSAKGWTDPSGDHHESTTVHYDPRVKSPEEQKS